MSMSEFKVHFSILKDPRIDRTKRHALVDILVIALCTMLSGGEGWEDMEEFGLSREDWLRERLGLELAHGIPTDDTFRRVFSRLDPQVFAQCFASWIRSFQEKAAGEVIALDGKTLRHSFDTATGQKALHVITAWATESGLALGQVKVDEKSNEITALPALLRMLDIAGCVVTTDAMGCQREVARQIIEQKGDYVLALKGNQTSLHDNVRRFFEDARAHAFYEKDPNRRIPHAYYETLEKDHGRVEKRSCWVVQGEAIDWLDQKEQWSRLGSICAVQCERRIGEKASTETRYFISSLTNGAEQIAQAVRSHWGIENGLHWVLDVAFHEDACGIWKDHSPENLATIRRAATSLLKQEKSTKRGIKARGRRAAWDIDYLLKVLVS